MLTLACARRAREGSGGERGRDDERSGCGAKRPLDLESVEKQVTCALAGVWRGAAARPAARASNAVADDWFPALFPPLRRRSAAKKTKKVEAAKNAKSGGFVGNARAKDVRGGGAGKLRVKPGTAAAAARS